MSFIDYDFFVIFLKCHIWHNFFNLYTRGNRRQQNVIIFFSDFPILSEVKGLL